jgi:Raf kinase inhibitor-like YbhB/YbcL family protein
MPNKKLLILNILLVLFLTGCGSSTNYNSSNYDGPIKVIINMQLRSPAFLNQEDIPIKYSCDGDNINPALQFLGVPKETKSLALIVDDPDASSGVWTHWLVWNINADTKKIQENNLPDKAVEGINDFNNVGWGGPCPPSGRHRYNFKLYALDTKLDLDGLSYKNDLIKAMASHIIQQTILTGYYERKSKY